ncbi:UNVERIFIED_CONTAM: hypothetical protein Sangu_1979100 [Sesamum angustifolium]|uniref:Endonuclease/exonuclease/phosphatase domain-containing protein n=1 Tax=Sesamum angustifolium TaxID=2727405 RepID=A0AAW2LXQ0_9LAMI
MKIGFWNVRGFNRPLKQNGVAHLIKNNQLCLLGILETKLAATAIPKIINRLFPGWCQANNFDAIAGGRILLSGTPQLLIFTRRIYRHKRSMWEKLLELGQPLNMPWIILGDFNCVKSPAEKQLGVPHLDFIAQLISTRRDASPTTLRGDRNTKFFHDMVKRNAARNSILAITKADGSIITSAPEIAQEFVNSTHRSWVLRIRHYRLMTGFSLGPSLTTELASNLCRAVTPEVKTAVFQISDNKAPGPDGYTSCFFKKAWNIVGDLVCSAVMDFFRSGRMLRQLNHTIIALAQI